MPRLPQLPAATPGSEWFAAGVRFRCLGPECGACCSGDQGPGAVWVGRGDEERLARHLELAPGELRRRYLRRLDGGWSLRERANFDCVFLDPGKGCEVYGARPTQCRTYPFWGRILASREAWRKEADKCPGIGCDDRTVAADEGRRQPEIDAGRRQRI